MIISPAITAQPAGLSVYPGHPAIFNVTATGIPAPIYQWTKNGANISGATASTYTIASPQGADAGVFAVVVSSTAGSVTSSNATLAVGDLTPPTKPTGLGYAEKTTTTVTLVWHASVDNVGVIGYHIFRDPLTNPNPIATTGELTFTDSGRAAGATYIYTVKAYDAAGNESVASNAVSVTTQAVLADTDGDGIPNTVEAALGTVVGTAALPDTNQIQQNTHRPTR